MRKEKFEKDYKVNLDKVVFELSKNGLYSFSKSIRGFYIIKENDDYKLVNEENNSIHQWIENLDGIEG